MTRFWIAVPIALMSAVPLWTAPTVPVLAIEALACLLCIIGALASAAVPVTAGASVGVIGYALALWSGDGGVDVLGAAVFGLAILSLLDMAEFARRFRGADVSEQVLRAQAAYRLRRAAIIAGAVAVLTLGGFVLSLLIPGAGRAVVAGAGAVLAFAGALSAGIIRRPGDI
jgi:hypothetical protein